VFVMCVSGECESVCVGGCVGCVCRVCVECRCVCVCGVVCVCVVYV